MAVAYFPFAALARRGVLPGESRDIMQIWPAIDLRAGKCVRLVQGDYARELVFGDDPVAMARRWVDQGAERLHLVDLDGARDGAVGNLAAIAAVARAVNVPLQVGGGVRDDAAVARLLECGASRLVVGTRALQDPEWFAAACRRHPGQLVLGIDARDGLAATHGWLATSTVRAEDLADRYRGLPLAGVVYTDIATDGMLAGPNVPAMAALQRHVAWPVIASGGVTTVADVERLAAAGLAGAIVGRALYEGRLALSDALQTARRATPAGAAPA